MKRTFGYWAWLICFSALLASCPKIDLDRVNTPDSTARYEDETLFFKGSIDEQSHDAFFKVAREHGEDIKSVQVDSGGGSTHYGRQIGRWWIYDHKVDVIVDGRCYSSCANYMFTAGKNKVIRNNALVGWHGSDGYQELVLANTKDMDKAFEHRVLYKIDYLIPNDLSNLEG